ncbi:MAG: hypothetical protein ABI838_03825, partial [Chloroflexota bacterium]
YRRVMHAGGIAAPGGGHPLSPSALRELVAIGSPRLLRDRVSAYRAVGCTLPIAMVCPNHPGAAGWEATIAALA